MEQTVAVAGVEAVVVEFVVKGELVQMETPMVRMVMLPNQPVRRELQNSATQQAEADLELEEEIVVQEVVEVAVLLAEVYHHVRSLVPMNTTEPVLNADFHADQLLELIRVLHRSVIMPAQPLTYQTTSSPVRHQVVGVVEVSVQVHLQPHKAVIMSPLEVIVPLEEATSATGII